MMRWGMPPPPRTGGPPVTNIRDISLPHWRVWRTSSNRKLLAPNRFQSMGTLHHCKLLSFLALIVVRV
jgi:putative SOS response-associated peptidase YedK